MYHIVVCSNCRYVWIVRDRPDTSQCGRCRKTRKFKLLKKYHKTDDEDEAKLARAFYQSRVNDQEEHFDRALERGVLEEDMDAFLSEDQFLEMQGMDAEQVENAVDNILSPSNHRSEIRVIRDALKELEEPDLDDFFDYTRENGIDDEKAVVKLEALIRSGRIDDSGNIQMSEIESKVDELVEDPSDDERQVPKEGMEPVREKETSPQRTKPDDTASLSQLEIIEGAIEDQEHPAEEDVIEYATERGVGQEKAQRILRKMRQNGDVIEGTDHSLRLI